MIGTETVAHASDATTVVDSETAEKSELGTCPWQLTADGVLHVGSGELPEATKPYSDYVTPFFAIQIREGADQNNLKFKTISFDGKVTTPVNASFLFANFLNDTPQIKNWQNLDTSKSTNFAFMFLSSQQNSIDVSKFDTSNATDMHGMFNGADPVKGYENLDTSKATDVSGMFANYNDNNDNPVSLDLAKLDVDRVNEDKSTTPFGASVAGGFSGMVGGANINSLNIGDWKPQIPLTGMFDGSMSSNLTELTLSPQDDLTGSKLLGPDTTEDKDPAKYTGNWENRQDQYIKHGDPNKKTYSTTDLIGKYNGQLAITENETYQWEPQVTPGNPVTIHYIDQDGKSIQADSQLPGGVRD
ncbi:hypothetical protein FD13_GL001645 [Levilactobacillus senmaizukei DSM 21775 = NBRC 103853]|uniref:BspA family leucine-rich repeat surface protein n=2 Tax=Levilactobacillus senmaizukei TaxID=431273 RepID=A0A0R2DFA2_9LACO|nr:hypothetical protein FD13_GL001645 [Levilactobacillus senmaizukei DSM 21775 = NBRC 103853]